MKKSAAARGGQRPAGTSREPGAQKKKRLPARKTPPTPPAVRLTGVSKGYGSTIALDGVDLDVPRGSIFGLVGPNGAGKTTTLSLIAGLLRPDAGAIVVDGADTVGEARAARDLTGILPDRLRTFDRLTGVQLLRYTGALRGLPRDTVATRSRELAEELGLTAALRRPVADYSGGMTKMIMLACALLHTPRVLVLDEPFEGVDPISSRTILDLLRRYTGGGGTVVLSSHGIELVEQACTRLAVMMEGHVLAQGTVDDVRGDMSLAARFDELVGSRRDRERLEWLSAFSD